MRLAETISRLLGRNRRTDRGRYRGKLLGLYGFPSLATGALLGLLLLALLWLELLGWSQLQAGGVYPQSDYVAHWHQLQRVESQINQKVLWVRDGLLLDQP
ncbi:MAG: hypothetical protein HC772_18255, partial [Leptolyngbyaceae cyanobacterium CRU_2_3]|nr:hypothetical protein [Leptolyngbyaceae cyanobacterium CRU_2_3]